ncbi:hypothetical protein [Umezawaea sp.]|uniref:hypothetical protein n=1 Tax=Umezawaea sp. TaxID=1955258 RepID=UPI002ED4587D
MSHRSFTGEVWRSGPANDDANSGTPNREVETFTADVAVATIPFPALRHVAVEPLMSSPKRRAVIEPRYDSATEVLLELAAGVGPCSERRTRGAPDHTFSDALSLVSP